MEEEDVDRKNEWINEWFVRVKYDKLFNDFGSSWSARWRQRDTYGQSEQRGNITHLDPRTTDDKRKEKFDKQNFTWKNFFEVMSKKISKFVL